jgi:hypothetical protein
LEQVRILLDLLMNVKQLKELLENIPDNTEIVVPGRDHSYSRTYKADIESAELYEGFLSEYYEPVAMSPPMKVLVIR